MSIYDCPDCVRYNDEVHGSRAVSERYKKDRDEALLIAETLRARLKTALDGTTQHDRLEQEMLSRLLLAAQKEDERLREELRVEKETTSETLEGAQKDRDDLAAEKVRLEGVVGEQLDVIRDLEHRLREHESLPLVRRVWPESLLERAFARVVVEACALPRTTARAVWYFGFVLIATSPVTALGILVYLIFARR